MFHKGLNKEVLIEENGIAAFSMRALAEKLGVMHGFVSQEASGYFSHYPVDLEESYRLAIGCVIDGLHKETEHHER